MTKKKYRASVNIDAISSKHIGEVEFDTIEEYFVKAEELWKSQNYYSPKVNISNDFELNGDWDISDFSEEMLEYSKND